MSDPVRIETDVCGQRVVVEITERDGAICMTAVPRSTEDAKEHAVAEARRAEMEYGEGV